MGPKGSTANSFLLEYAFRFFEVGKISHWLSVAMECLSHGGDAALLALCFARLGRNENVQLGLGAVALCGEWCWHFLDVWFH